MKKARLLTLFLTISMILTTLPVSASEPLLIAPAPTELPPLISPAPDNDSTWLLPAVHPLPDFPDVEDSWCDSAVDVAYQVGLMEGKTTDFFDIRGSLTYAHITVVTARLGTSIPTTEILPGTAAIRTPEAPKLKAISSAQVVSLFSRTPFSSSTS